MQPNERQRQTWGGSDPRKVCRAAPTFNWEMSGLFGAVERQRQIRKAFIVSVGGLLVTVRMLKQEKLENGFYGVGL